METRANYVAVGAFVLAVLAGVVVVLLWLARVQFNHVFAHYDIYFTGSVTGLTQGSAVTYNGIQIGRVIEIRIDPQNLQQVRVTIEVDQPTLIRSDAVASLEVQGLTGVAFVEITGGSQNAPPLEAQLGQRYPVIASRPSGLQRVVSSAPEALSRLIEVADRLAEVLDDRNRAAITETLDNMRRLSAVAAARSGDIDSALGDGAAAMRELRATISEARQTAADLRQLVAQNGEGAEALKSINETSRKLDQLATHLDAMVQENRQPLRDFSQRSLSQFSQLLVDARTLVAGLTRLTDDLQRDPPRFFFGDRRQGYQPR
jgi:phospholipid/cholesterol/gamma-HCH transport system substrate-binding protein